MFFKTTINIWLEIAGWLVKQITQRFAYGTESPLCRYATGNGVMTLCHGTPRHGSTLALRMALVPNHFFEPGCKDPATSFIMSKNPHSS